ncbi:MAG: dihydrofolate reductase family protein, partial [Thaumarchaeota archaeon]|nr:dihydrofolate reductase family protein [Nitrososphaerota archaeon]
YFDDFMGKVMGEQTGHPFDLLLGRTTYNIFASYWPHQDEKTTPFAAEINRARKYVASHSPLEPEWNNSLVLRGDVVEEIKKLKGQDGPELQVHGSGNLIRTLLKNDLVDEFWLKIFPVTLGSGKRLFAEGSIPASLTLTASKTSPKGVIIANYVRAGEVKTGSF